MRSIYTTGVFLVALLGVVACSPGTGMRSEEVEPPLESGYALAYVTGVREPVEGAGGVVQTRLRHVLALKKEGERLPHQAELVRALEGTEAFQGLLGARWEVNFAPDGRAVVVRREGTEEWRYVGLEEGLSPLSYRGVFWKGDSFSWDNAPTTRELVFEILRSSTLPGDGPGRADIRWVHGKRGDKKQKVQDLKNLAKMEFSFGQEVRFAWGYAQKYAGDAEVRREVIRAALLPGLQRAFVEEESRQLIIDMAKKSSEAQKLLRDGVGGEGYEMALDVLIEAEIPGVLPSILPALLKATEGEGEWDARRLEVYLWAADWAIRRGEKPGDSLIQAVHRIVQHSQRSSPPWMMSVRFAIDILGLVGQRGALEGLVSSTCRTFSYEDKVLHAKAHVREKKMEPRTLELARVVEQKFYFEKSCWARKVLGEEW